MKANTVDFTKAILLLRFPLAVLVVYLHSRPEVVGAGADLESMPILLNLTSLVSGNITRIAVPAFFFISGYLFFLNMEKWEWNRYVDKLKRRFHTLVIPFVVWNLLVFGIYFCIQTFAPSLIHNDHELIRNYGLTDYLSAFGFNLLEKPICYQLWFIRDLIVLVLLCPLFYAIIANLRRWRYFVLISVMLIALVGGGNFIDDIYFVLGACFPVLNIRIEPLLRRLGSYTVVIYITILILEMVGFNNELGWNFMKLCGVMSVFWMASLVSVQRFSLPSIITQSTFFIYAYHGLALMALTRAIVKILHISSDMGYCFVYLMVPIVTIILGVIGFQIVKRMKLSYLLTGSR